MRKFPFSKAQILKCATLQSLINGHLNFDNLNNISELAAYCWIRPWNIFEMIASCVSHIVIMNEKLKMKLFIVVALTHLMNRRCWNSCLIPIKISGMNKSFRFQCVHLFEKFCSRGLNAVSSILHSIFLHGSSATWNSI